MQSALAENAVSSGEIWRAFPRWINARHRSFGGKTFEAVERSDREPPELAVTMWNGDVPVATYKCGINCLGGPGNAWIVFAPLVVLWTGGRPAHGFEQGRLMVDHLCASARKFHRAHGTYDEALLVASGNLTEEKGGTRFFGALGWEIATPNERQPASLYLGAPTLMQPLAVAERVIEDAIAPLRSLGKVGDEPVSFAFLPLD